MFFYQILSICGYQKMQFLFSDVMYLYALSVIFVLFHFKISAFIAL